MPSAFSATSQNGIARIANAVTTGICNHSGKAVFAYASATPGSDPKVPGANGATNPIPNPLATNTQNFFMSPIQLFGEFLDAEVMPGVELNAVDLDDALLLPLGTVNFLDIGIGVATTAIDIALVIELELKAGG